jgi:hypothetical protein
VYDPELAARAILHAAEHPARDLTVGGGGRVMSLFGSVAPRLTDRVMEWTMFSGQRTDEPVDHRGESLYRPGDAHELETRGGYGGHVRRTSTHDLITRHPVAAAGVALLLGAAVGSAWFGLSAKRQTRTDRAVAAARSTWNAVAPRRWR